MCDNGQVRKTVKVIMMIMAMMVMTMRVTVLVVLVMIVKMMMVLQWIYNKLHFDFTFFNVLCQQCYGNIF